MSLLRPYLAGLLLIAAAAAQTPTIDLKPFGFLPTNNAQYFPEFNSSAVAYLGDGSLVVGFRRPEQGPGKAFAADRPLMPVRLLRFDARSGKLLAQSDTVVERGGAWFTPAPDNQLLLPGAAKFVLLDSALHPIAEFPIPADAARIDLAADSARFALSTTQDKIDHWQVLSLPKFQKLAAFDLPEDTPLALLDNGHATLRPAPRTCNW